MIPSDLVRITPVIDTVPLPIEQQVNGGVEMLYMRGARNLASDFFLGVLLGEIRGGCEAPRGERRNLFSRGFNPVFGAAEAWLTALAAFCAREAEPSVVPSSALVDCLKPRARGKAGKKGESAEVGGRRRRVGACKNSGVGGSTTRTTASE